MAIICVCRASNILTWFDEILDSFEKTFDWLFSLWQKKLLTLADCLMLLGIISKGQIWTDIWSHCSSAVWPHLAKFRKYSLVQSLDYLVFGKILNLFWQTSYYWAHFNCCKWLNIKKEFCHLVILLVKSHIFMAGTGIRFIFQKMISEQK